MSTAIAKAKRKPLSPELVPMTADEAVEALSQMNRYVIDWSRSLLEFSQREGWKVLGYVSLKECLASKLRVGAEAAMCVLRAAQVREELAGLANDKRLQDRIWSMPDSHTVVLSRLEQPRKRLDAVKRTVGLRTNFLWPSMARKAAEYQDSRAGSLARAHKALYRDVVRLRQCCWQEAQPCSTAVA